MQPGAWRAEVVQLLSQCVEALHVKNDKHAVTYFGTAMAYLQQAVDEGDPTATALLAQAADIGGDGGTQRFSYAPGELERLADLRTRGE